MAPLANPSESVSLFAMFSFFLLKNISMFPDLEMINKMHKNGEKQCVSKKHCSHGKCVFHGVWGGVAEGAGGSDPALSPLWRVLGQALTSLRLRLSFSKMKHVKQFSRDRADGLITNVRPGETPGMYLGLNR